MTCLGIAVFGCTPHEKALVCELAPRLGVRATVTGAPLMEATVALAAGHRCISVGHKATVTNATLRALGDVGVRYLSTRSAGVDHLDVGYAAGVGITVEGVTYSPDSVADYTLMLMLMAVRHAKSVLCRAAEHDYRLPDVPGRELRDLTVGVVGTGRIGSAVVDRLRGFRCRVLTHDRRPGAGHVLLDELLRESDIVSLHTPLTADTQHLLDRRRIGLLKRGAYVVNTGRGALVDTVALVAALDGGRLGGAALDVVEGEEGVFYADRRGRAIDPLLQRLHAMPNVLLSPHTAFHTDRATRDMVENSLRSCLAFERGHSRG